VRLVQIALLALAGLYGGDYLSARYRIPNNRQTLGSVQVKTLYAVRQKNGRIEYLDGDTEVQTCLRSLFPHLGYTPCWYLSRHATERIEVVRVDQSIFTAAEAAQCWIGMTTAPGGEELMLAGDVTPLMETEIGYTPGGSDAKSCGTVKLIWNSPTATSAAAVAGTVTLPMVTVTPLNNVVVTGVPAGEGANPVA